MKSIMVTSVNGNNYTNQKARGLKRKYEYVISRGGKCQHCGYNKNLSALEFHHLDPSTKEFEVDIRQFSNTCLDKLHVELDKCELICSNCHRELHNPSLEMVVIPEVIEACKKKSFNTIKDPGTLCPFCNNYFPKLKGKLYCSKECNEADKRYPPYNQLVEHYNLLHSWEKVAQHFKITRRIIQRIRRINNE